MKRGLDGSLLWRLLLPMLMCACASSLPDSRPDVDAALASYQPSGIVAQAAIESELLDRAWSRDPEDPWHEVALLHTGTDALTARAHLIRAARESIDIQVFAWEPDEAGEFLLQLLLEAAQRGVRVRLLVDLMANQGRAGVARICALHSNLNLRFYNPVGRRSKISGQEFLREVTVSFRWTNQRMHNKVMVVDGRVAIVGGRNIGESYFDMDTEFNYLDRDVLVVGPAAGSAETSFEQYWEWERTIPAAYLDDVADELLEWSAESPPPAVRLSPLPRYDWVRERSKHASIEENLLFTRMHRVERVIFVADQPGKRPWKEATAEARLRNPDYAENEAREYILLQSNYLVLSQRRVVELAKLAERRPVVRLSFLTNSLAATANHMVYGVGRKRRTRILQLGLEIAELRPLPGDIRHLCPRYDELVSESREQSGDASAAGPAFAIHAKSMVVDGKLSMVSSHNLDPRSDDLNTEAGVLIWSPEVTSELEQELRLAMSNANAWRSALHPRIPVLSPVNDVITGLSRALPIFDLWPVRDNGNYELREGATPLPTGAPDFHEHYTRVGEFPGPVSTGKAIKTRLFSVFGGLLLGLL